MATVLVTCAGSGVGQSVLDSLNLKRNHKLIGCDGNRNVYAHNFCDDFFEAPRIDSDGYIDFLLELCAAENVDILVPGHDQELLLMSKNIEKFWKENVEVIISEPDFIEISRDKQEWFKHFSELGCNIVPTYSVEEFKENPDTSILPAIVKPVGGSASQGISIINDLSELDEVNDSDIIQPYLFPEKEDKNYEGIVKAVKNGKFIQKSEISIQLIFSRESEFSGIFISKNTLKKGVPVFVDPIAPEEFEYLDEIMKFVPILKEKGVRGPVNIQGRITDQGLVFFEMNMRFTGITGNRALLGFNEVDYLVDDHLGIDGHLKNYAPNKLGVRQVACTTIPRKNKSTEVYTILGAGGFIGSNFLESLIQKNSFKHINLICRDASYEDYVERFASERIHVFKASDEKIETIYCQTDVLVNFVSALAYHPDADQYKSILFQYEQVQKIIKANIPLVLNISSQSVYDQSLDKEKTEDADITIDDAYAFQKFIAEKFFSSPSSFSPSVTSISVRFSRVLGGDDRKVNGFFARAVDSLLKGETIDIPHPFNKTNIIDIRDAVGALNFIIENKDEYEFPKVLNVGGSNLSMKNYCNTIVDQLENEQKKKLINYSNSEAVQASSMVDSSVFKSFGWEPQFSVQQIIQNFVETSSVKHKVN